jgi:hypothetical protein
MLYYTLFVENPSKEFYVCGILFYEFFLKKIKKIMLTISPHLWYDSIVKVVDKYSTKGGG